MQIRKPALIYTMIFVNAYAPTKDATEAIKERFYEDPQRAAEGVPHVLRLLS